MAVDVERIADELEAELRAIGTEERAAGERRYLKSDLEHLGVTVGQNRRAVRALVKQHPGLDRYELTALVSRLWSRGIFDCRLAAVLLLDASAGLLDAEDLPFLCRLVREARTWALVDVLAGDVIGAIVARDPRAAAQLDEWASDPDLWVRRAALLSNLEPLKHGAGFDRFARYADAMLEEREFFIRKAIGWVLREAGKRDPAQVYAWLAPRIDRASGVTVREAVKYLDPSQRRALLDARRR